MMRSTWLVVCAVVVLAGGCQQHAAPNGGCTVGAKLACYTGPAATRGVGDCTDGEQLCASDRTWGACTGEVTPKPETCVTPGDEDCDGVANESGASCVCVPGTTQSCYTGPAGTEGVGACTAGTQTCDTTGTSWGACTGEVTPVPEVCANGIDEDCNGVADDAPDLDGDGWTRCDGDCCDDPSTCASPASVNPGAFEVAGNGVDDDCDPTTPDTGPVDCSTSAKFGGVTALDLARAMGLCRSTTQNAPLADRTWGLIDASFTNADGSTPAAAALTAMQDSQSAVLADYGTGGVLPISGATMAGISTGMMRDEDDPGYVAPNPGTDFGRTGNPPAGYLAAHAGSLPSLPSCNGTGCAVGSGANDSIDLRLVIRVPTNATFLDYEYRFFSSEYAQYACSAYNDFHLALLTSGAAGLPGDGNIAFDANGNPMSVNSGSLSICTPSGCYACFDGATQLQGTGMEVNATGGGTPWLQVRAPVVAGETITLDMMIFDVTDGTLDSIVLLDGFHWE